MTGKAALRAKTACQRAVQAVNTELIDLYWRIGDYLHHKIEFDGFFGAYRDDPKLSPLVRVLPWTHDLVIFGPSNRPEGREFYLRMASQERWGKRELERQTTCEELSWSHCPLPEKSGGGS